MMDYIKEILEAQQIRVMIYNRERLAREAKKRRVMEGKKLQCGECGFLADTVCETEEHAKDYCHTNFFLSYQPFIDQHCCSCPTYCNSPMALQLHRRRSGHKEFEDTKTKQRREEAEEARRREETVKEILAKYQAGYEKEIRSQTRLFHKQLQMRSCLDSIKNSMKYVHQEQGALNTLVQIVKNVAEKPEEKYRKIRISVIQKRFCYVEAGLKFLELCKFEKDETGEFLVLPSYEVEEELLNAAQEELNEALSTKDKRD